MVLVSKSLTYSKDLRFARTHRQKEEALCYTVNLRLLYVHLNLYSNCTDVHTSDVSCKLERKDWLRAIYRVTVSLSIKLKQYMYCKLA